MLQWRCVWFGCVHKVPTLPHKLRDKRARFTCPSSACHPEASCTQRQPRFRPPGFPSLSLAVGDVCLVAPGQLRHLPRLFIPLGGVGSHPRRGRTSEDRPQCKPNRPIVWNRYFAGSDLGRSPQMLLTFGAGSVFLGGGAVLGTEGYLLPSLASTLKCQECLVYPTPQLKVFLDHQDYIY